MKVVCDRGALLDAVNVVSGAVASRTPRPQLTCVLLIAKVADGAGELTLAGADGEISLRLRTARVDVAEPGEALIPADKLKQIVQAEDAEPTLTLETDGEVCHIRGEDAHFQVYGYPASEFPKIPDFNDVTDSSSARASLVYPAGELGGMIGRTIFATARENTRYAINGVLMRQSGKKLELVATDGRRLAIARGALKKSAGEPASCIVPTKALSMLQRLIEDEEEPVHIAITENQILFALGDAPEGEARAVLASNLVEGTFPPVDDVIPRDQNVRIAFDRDVLTSAVRRAALLTNEESRGVRMAFKAADRTLELTSRAPEMGEAQVQVELKSYDGDDIEIGFNPSFITDALKVVADAEVIMELKSAESPGQPSQKPGVVKSGSDFLYVVMPVNLQ